MTNRIARAESRAGDLNNWTAAISRLRMGLSRSEQIQAVGRLREEQVPDPPATGIPHRSGAARHGLFRQGMQPYWNSVPLSTDAGRLSHCVRPRSPGMELSTLSGSSAGRARQSEDGAGSTRYRSPAVLSHRADECRSARCHRDRPREQSAGKPRPPPAAVLWRSRAPPPGRNRSA